MPRRAKLLVVASNIREISSFNLSIRGDIMRKSTIVVALFGLGVALGLAAATATQAHHAVNAQFDVSKQYSFTGVLTKVDWINPHAWFHFDVKKEDGTVEQWATETIGPNGLRRLGLSDRRLFVIGETYKVEYNPDRSGAHLGFTNSFTFPDGKYVKVGFIDESGVAK
jgi:Family of unknown function (DUF6152)